MLYQSVRGTKDLFFDEVDIFEFIQKQTAITSKKFGFSKVITPILEFKETFASHLGETNDIVNKEMYTFLDKSGKTLALRPEGTAALVRMLLSNGLIYKLPLKFFYFGPMFRYERPQKGRQRQFYQFGVEHFMATTPMSDALLILLAQNILQSLDVKNYTLVLNNIGTYEEQQKFSVKLAEYLEVYKKELSIDSQKRIQSNPLRVLDSKSPEDQKILADAPRILNSLSSSSIEYFNKILDYLTSMSIKYQVSSNLVRGLDYYTGLVFEFTSDVLASQAILAGGRYNNLIKNMGGPHVPSIGFAAGVERLTLLLKSYKEKKDTKVAILSLFDKASKKVLNLISYLLTEPNMVIEFIEEGSNLTKKLKKANKICADFAIIIGEEEFKNQTVLIKNLHNSLQVTIEMNNVLNIKKFLKSKTSYTK